MIDYYKVLGIKRTASKAEIRSAYRKLAKTLHPDFNAGSTTATREFALLSKAYHVLIDPRERIHYDERLTAQKSAPASILHSDNRHARRARNVAVQARWDRVVDEVLDRDRRETLERQRAVFTTVSLFLSTFFLAMLKPHLWEVFDYGGRVIVITLFVIGSWHLVSRLREYLGHYTYKVKPIQASIMSGEAPPEQPFSRSSAYAFLILGYGISIAVGLFIGWHAQAGLSDVALLNHFPGQVSQSHLFLYSPPALLAADLILYPPIAVLIIDSMHELARRFD